MKNENKTTTKQIHTDQEELHQKENRNPSSSIEQICE